MAKSPEEISVRDVFIAVEEPITPVECAAIDGNHNDCTKVDHCLSLILWRKLAQSIVETLDSITLADLCNESVKLERASIPEHNYVYNI